MSMNAPNRTEVSSLKAENERLRAALQEIIDEPEDGAAYCKAIARAALNQQKTDDTPQAFIDAKKERDDGWPDR